MNRQQAVEQHLHPDNFYVYRRNPDGSVRQVFMDSPSADDRRHYLLVRQEMENQLAQVPDDILLASTATESRNRRKRRPLAITVVEGDKDGFSRTEELVWAHHVDKKTALDYGAFHQDETSNGQVTPPYKDRVGMICVSWKRMKEFKDTTLLVHEFGHHYLSCCLSPDRSNRFLTELGQACRVDKSHINQAFFRYVTKNPDREKYDMRSEFYTYALESLAGKGKAIFENRLQPVYDFEKCPHILGCLLKHHPTWINMVEKPDVAPEFAREWKEKNGWSAKPSAQRPQQGAQTML